MHRSLLVRRIGRTLSFSWTLVIAPHDGVKLAKCYPSQLSSPFDFACLVWFLQTYFLSQVDILCC